jgi:hypothetical protein
MSLNLNLVENSCGRADHLSRSIQKGEVSHLYLPTWDDFRWRSNFRGTVRLEEALKAIINTSSSFWLGSIMKRSFFETSRYTSPLSPKGAVRRAELVQIRCRVLRNVQCILYCIFFEKTKHTEPLVMSGDSAFWASSRQFYPQLHSRRK